MHAKPSAIKEILQEVEAAVPTTGKSPQKVEAVSDGKVQKKADSQFRYFAPAINSCRPST